MQYVSAEGGYDDGTLDYTVHKREVRLSEDMKEFNGTQDVVR